MDVTTMTQSELTAYIAHIRNRPAGPLDKVSIAMIRATVAILSAWTGVAYYMATHVPGSSLNVFGKLAAVLGAH